jgi:hypothetical protein
VFSLIQNLAFLRHLKKLKIYRIIPYAKHFHKANGKATIKAIISLRTSLLTEQLEFQRVAFHKY